MCTPNYNVAIFSGVAYRGGASLPLSAYVLYDRKIMKRNTTFRLNLQNFYDPITGNNEYRKTGSNGFNNTTGRPNYIYRYAAARAADVERAKQWIEAAARLGAPVLRVFAGPVPPKPHTWDDGAKWMADFVRSTRLRIPRALAAATPKLRSGAAPERATISALPRSVGYGVRFGVTFTF